MKVAHESPPQSASAVREVHETAPPDRAQVAARKLPVNTSSALEDAEKKSLERTGGSRWQGRHLKDLAIWSRQLCVLVRSGTPLAQALGAVERQAKPGLWRDLLAEVRQLVEEGSPLSVAMERTSAAFDAVTRSLIAAGETSGQLGAMLERVASMTRQQLKLRRTILGAMVYPILLMSIGVIVVLVMLLGVLPRFSELFETMGASTPPTTAFLMSISAMLKSYWWALIIGLVGIIAGALAMLSTPAGQYALQQFLLRLPLFGRVLRSLATAKICRLIGVLLESRVPLLECLRLTKNATGLTQYAELMVESEKAATRGEPVSGVFLESPLIIPMVSEAMSQGEKNAQIGPILLDMADFLDEENETLVRTLTGVLEPVILIGLGFVVGFIALSLFIPLFDISAMAGGAQ